MVLEAGDLDQDEDTVLKDSFHSFKRLKFSHSIWAPFACEAAALAAASEAVLLLSAAARALPSPAAARCCGALASSIALWRLATAAVLAAGMAFGGLHKRLHRRSMVYWSWFPCLGLLACMAAAVAGSCIGDHIWRKRLQPYYQLAALQPYTDVNPAIVPSSQLQDAGVVEFSPGVDVDRSRGGCLVHGGHTYCVAPILYGGQLFAGLGNSPQSGSYDYYAVGVDCCSCPNQDFRCGDWKNPMAQGGLRSTDTRSRPFFRLAVDDFAAAYMKRAGKPALFFDWVQDPVWQLQSMRLEALHMATFGCLLPVPLLAAAGMLAAVTLRGLVISGAASPLDAPPPPAGFERAWVLLLPGLMRQREEDRQQLMTLPITPAPAYAVKGMAPERAPAAAAAAAAVPSYGAA